MLASHPKDHLVFNLDLLLPPLPSARLPLNSFLHSTSFGDVATTPESPLFPCPTLISLHIGPFVLFVKKSPVSPPLHKTSLIHPPPTLNHIIIMMSDEEDFDCPLCMEELDISDRNFRPCPCGYQVWMGFCSAALYASFLNIYCLYPIYPSLSITFLDLSFLLASHQGGSQWSLPCMQEGLHGRDHRVHPHFRR